MGFPLFLESETNILCSLHVVEIAQLPAPVKTQAVVVENPSTLDENGNEVPSIVVGMQKAS